MNNENKKKKIFMNDADLERIMHQAGITSFSPFFQDKVISGLSRPDVEKEESYRILMRFFKPLSLTTAILLVALTVYNFSAHGNISVDALIGLPEITVEHMAMAIE